MPFRFEKINTYHTYMHWFQRSNTKLACYFFMQILRYKPEKPKN